MDAEIKIFGKKIEKQKLYEFIKFFAKLGLLLLIIGSIFLLNYSVLLSPDDYNYTFVQGTYMQKKVDSLENALETAKYFYNNWTGRVIPHVLIGIFRNINPMIYQIVNTIAFIVFIVFAIKILNKKTTFLSVLSVFGYLTFSRMFGEKFAWISGAFNYLWPAMFLSIFIYYFYNYFNDKKELKLFGKIALILYAFIVGFMHENVAFVGGSFLLCLILFNIKKVFKFEKSKKIVIILTFITFCIGAFATIFAPGNLTRASQTDTSFTWEFLNNYVLNKWPIIITLISIVIVFILENIEKIKNRNLKNLNFEIVKEEILIFILPVIIATIPMAIISYFPERAFLAYETMFIIVFAKNVQYIAKYFEKYNIAIAIISIALTLIVFGRFSPSTLGQINYIIPYKTALTNQLEEAKERGQKNIAVSEFEYLQWIHREDGINIYNFFPEFIYKMPVNVLIAQYYGFDKVSAISNDEYLIEIKVDKAGINKYSVINTETGEKTQKMDYDNIIRFPILKTDLGKHKLQAEEGTLKEHVLDYNILYVGGELTKEQVSIDDLIIK